MLKFLKVGFFSTLQDRGRYGYRHYGVPVSGAMDQYAATIANNMLDNDEDAALLEITMTGPELEFGEPTFIVLSGARVEATINKVIVPMNQVWQIYPGDILKFGRMKAGFRTYLAVRGGFTSEKILGSRSFYPGITPLSRLTELQEIPYTPQEDFSPRISQMSPEPISEINELEVNEGPEFHLLEEKQVDRLFGSPFSVAKENDRMAYQLEEALTGHSISMITSATLPGTVQFTPAGKLIILMRDGQTTGGYPRILQLTDRAISILAQKKYGDKLRFRRA